MSLSSNFKTLSHHAYCLVGGESLRTELKGLLESEHGISAQGNPDFFDKTYANLVIDDTREVKTFHTTKPIGKSGKKIFILTMNGITIEAQNALLKLLEEPAEYAHFFLIISSSHLLLPTVKSRLKMLESVVEQESDETKREANKFLALNQPQRLEYIKAFMSEIDKEKKTKQDAIVFLNSLQSLVYEKDGVARGKEKLESIDLARKYIYDRSPSVKMLLEYLALSI